jgi:hypothetical protein
MVIWDDVDPENPLDVAAIINDVNLSHNKLRLRSPGAYLCSLEYSRTSGEGIL